MNILLIGPSGAGKGTQAGPLVGEFNLARISTGDLFRDNLQNNTALGLLAKKHMNLGDLVPDEIVDAMVVDWLHGVPAARDILFDGFPRTLHQARFLDEVFASQSRTLDAAVYLRIPDQIALERLAGRLVCSACNTPYHVDFQPPKLPGYCDVCGGSLLRRDDDSPKIVEARLRSFHQAIDPVLEYYQGQDKLIIIDAVGAIEVVHRSLVEAVKSAEQRLLRRATLEQVKAIEAPPLVILRPEEVARPSLDLVLLGGPGSGKGTQAEQICAQIPIPHISTGDLFRDHLKKGTELGKTAKAYMDRGELVPDNVTDSMVEDRLAQPDARDGFLLDGFPRRLAQARALDEILTRAGRRLSGAIYIVVSDDEITRRLAGRRICSRCQASYHMTFKPPAKPGICDICGGELYQRDDDNPATIAARLKTFHFQIGPLVNYYHERSQLVEIAGEGLPREVSTQTVAAALALSPPGGPRLR